MDTIIIISIILLTILIGITIGWLVFGRRKNEVSTIEGDSSHQTQLLMQQLNDSETKIHEIKQRYENLLNDAKGQIHSLDEKLKTIMENGADEEIKKQLDEVNELKKKIKSLQEENEELEDDIEEYRKKLKSKELDFSRIQDELDRSLRQKEQIDIKLKEVVEDLEEKTHDLDVKIESLQFVQEVLTAKRTTDELVNNIHTRIDNLSDYIGGELRDVIADIKKLDDNWNDALYGSGLESWKVTAKKTWIQGKTSIAFVGEFSAGKTSIVNRILSQDDPKVPLLPVSTKATTAIPTYISGGVGTLYQFVTPNNELKCISEETFKRVNKEVLDQVKGVSSLIQYFVMTYKNPHLNKLSILDTPGFNSNDKEDSERTIGVINECDALFWVFDVNAGTVNRASIDLIKAHLKKPLYIVINKVDTKAVSDVDKVEQLIRKTLTESGLSVQGVIRFSSKAPLNDIMKPISTITHNDERENYLNRLSDIVTIWTDEQEKEVISAKKEADDLLKKSNSLVDKYNSSISMLNDHCVTVSNIPHYETRYFGFKECFEMTQSEYSQMINLLQIIYGQDCIKLCDLYNEQMETRANLQEAWSTHAEKRQQWQRLNQCKNILIKKIKELKQ